MEKEGTWLQHHDAAVGLETGCGTVDFVVALPAEVSLHVLSFVPLSEVGCTLTLVSRTWKRFADDDALWRAAASASMGGFGFGSGLKKKQQQPQPDGSGDQGLFKAVLKEILTSNPLRDTCSLSPTSNEDEPNLDVTLGPWLDTPMRYETQVAPGCDFRDIHEVKVAVLGDCGVGKSALTVMLIQQLFVEAYAPTNEDSYRKMTRINDLVVFFHILDTAGLEDFAALGEQWIQPASALLCVYSVTDRKSFNSITERPPIEGFWPMIKRLRKDAPFSMILVGNKCDVDETTTITDGHRTDQVREVTPQEGAALAREMSSDLGMPVPFLETSAKRNHNVAAAFGAHACRANIG